MTTDTIARFRRLFDYNAWANREALASLHAAGEAPGQAVVKRMAHIAAAERLWISRLTEDREAVAVWPDINLEECGARLEVPARLWPTYLSRLTPEALSTAIRYTNTRGETFTNAVEDILTHVLLHSAYHRGQIAADLRAAGHTPAVTDYIHAVRQGMIA